MEELPPTWRLRLWEELVDFDGFASYWKAIGKSWESSADLCLASRERLETKSGAECVSAAWQNVLHVKSSQDTINKKEKTKQNNYRFYLDFLQRLTCTPQTSRRPPSWAGSQGLGARLLSLSLWIAHICFCLLCLFHIQRARPPESSCASGPYLDICLLCSSWWSTRWAGPRWGAQWRTSARWTTPEWRCPPAGWLQLGGTQREFVSGDWRSCTLSSWIESSVISMLSNTESHRCWNGNLKWNINNDELR